MRSHAAPRTAPALDAPEARSASARGSARTRTPEPPRQRHAEGGGARPIPGDLGRSFEAALGHRFGDVRVHAGADGARMAREGGAAAVTVGRDIFFGAGRYRPGTPEGQSLLAHELVHVAQWRRGGGARAVGPLPAARRAGLEAEARDVGERAMGGGHARVAGTLPHATPLLHPVYISRHGRQGYLNLAHDFFHSWGYGPITRDVDSIQQIVGDLATRSSVGRVTIVSHAHPTNINMRLLDGGPPHVMKDDMEALTVPRTGVIGPSDTPPATVRVPGILPTATPTARTEESFEALLGREGESVHLLPEDQLEALMTAIAADAQATASLARIGNADDAIVRQYVWWTLDDLFVPQGGFGQDRATRLRRITERARESYRGTIQVAAAAAPQAITDRDFERLDQEIARLTAAWAWPVLADEPARAAAERRAGSSPYAVVNAILWNPDFLPELAGADRRVRVMVEALPEIEDHYLDESTRDDLVQRLPAGVLDSLGGAGDRLVRQWVWWVMDGHYPRVRGFGQNARTRIEAAAATRRRAYRDLIQEAFRAAGNPVPDQAAFDAAAQEVRQTLAGFQFPGAAPPAGEQRDIAAQIEGSTDVTGVTRDSTFLRQLEVVRAMVTSHTWLEIQGCRAGQDRTYLVALRDLFANSRARPKVSAPSWFQMFGHYGWRPVNDAGVPGEWQQQHVQDAFAYWYPILTGNPAPPAPTAQDLLDFLRRPMVLPTISPGNLANNALLLHDSVGEDALLAWLAEHGYRLTREADIRQQLFQAGALGANVSRSLVDWLAEQRQGGEVRFRPDPDYQNHIETVT